MIIRDDKKFSNLVGLSVKDANELLADDNLFVRVTVRDNQHLAVTCDFSANRLNVETKDGIITKLNGFG